jgi:hypothetical protein
MHLVSVCYHKHLSVSILTIDTGEGGGTKHSTPGLVKFAISVEASLLNITMSLVFITDAQI